MSESHVSPDWLEQAAREARDVIERLYTEGRTALGEALQDQGDAPPPVGVTRAAGPPAPAPGGGKGTPS